MYRKRLELSYPFNCIDPLIATLGRLAYYGIYMNDLLVTCQGVRP